MRVTQIIADLQVSDVVAANDFYPGYLGLAVEESNLGWVARYTCEETKASLPRIRHDAAAQRSLGIRSRSRTSKTPMPRRSSAASRSCIPWSPRMGCDLLLRPRTGRAAA